MARYKLPPQASYKKIRCRLRREGLTLNTRFGELYTMKRCEKYDPATEKQMLRRKLFAEACAFAGEEIRNPERLRVWTRYAHYFKYKTARSAAFSYYFRRKK